MSADALLDPLVKAAHELGRAGSSDAQWAAIAQAAQAMFGYRLLTGLVYLHDQRLMRRIHTSDEAISPLGGFKATGQGPWSKRVLNQGMPHIGSNAADIRSVFSEADLLIAQGLHAVLNLPIWCQGRVIGSLNLLGGAQAYDGADARAIGLLAGVCAPVFLQAHADAGRAAATLDRSTLDSV